MLAVGQTMYRAYVEGSWVRYEEFTVVKPTPKGGWVRRFSDWRSVERSVADDTKWVRLDGRFCSTTKEEALSRLKARSRSYVKHCRRRLAEAERRMAVLADGVEEVPKLSRGSFF